MGADEFKENLSTAGRDTTLSVRKHISGYSPIIRRVLHNGNDEEAQREQRYRMPVYEPEYEDRFRIRDADEDKTEIAMARRYYDFDTALLDEFGRLTAETPATLTAMGEPSLKLREETAFNESASVSTASLEDQALNAEDEHAPVDNASVPLAPSAAIDPVASPVASTSPSTAISEEVHTNTVEAPSDQPQPRANAPSDAAPTSAQAKHIGDLLKLPLEEEKEREKQRKKFLKNKKKKADKNIGRFTTRQVELTAEIDALRARKGPPQSEIKSRQEIDSDPEIQQRVNELFSESLYESRRELHLARIDPEAPHFSTSSERKEKRKAARAHLQPNSVKRRTGLLLPSMGDEKLAQEQILSSKQQTGRQSIDLEASPVAPNTADTALDEAVAEAPKLLEHDENIEVELSPSTRTTKLPVAEPKGKKPKGSSKKAKPLKKADAETPPPFTNEPTAAQPEAEPPATPKAAKVEKRKVEKLIKKMKKMTPDEWEQEARILKGKAYSMTDGKEIRVLGDFQEVESLEDRKNREAQLLLIKERAINLRREDKERRLEEKKDAALADWELKRKEEQEADEREVALLTERDLKELEAEEEDRKEVALLIEKKVGKFKAEEEGEGAEALRGVEEEQIQMVHLKKSRSQTVVANENKTPPPANQPANQPDIPEGAELSQNGKSYRLNGQFFSLKQTAKSLARQAKRQKKRQMSKDNRARRLEKFKDKIEEMIAEDPSLTPVQALTNIHWESVKAKKEKRLRKKGLALEENSKLEEVLSVPKVEEVFSVPEVTSPPMRKIEMRSHQRRKQLPKPRDDRAIELDINKRRKIRRPKGEEEATKRTERTARKQEKQEKPDFSTLEWETRREAKRQARKIKMLRAQARHEARKQARLERAEIMDMPEESLVEYFKRKEAHERAVQEGKDTGRRAQRADRDLVEFFKREEAQERAVQEGKKSSTHWDDDQ